MVIASVFTLGVFMAADCGHVCCKAFVHAISVAHLCMELRRTPMKRSSCNLLEALSPK